MARSRSRRALTGFAAVALTAPMIATASVAQAAPSIPINDNTEKTYIVQLADAPVASYDGSVPGFAATKPAEGEKVDPDSSATKKWQDRLESKQDNSLKAVGVNTSKKVATYSLAFNGYAAKLTPAEILRLQRTPGVIRVWENETREADTSTTPDMLGLTGPDGVWAQQFKGRKDAGKGIVIGVIDSGINSLHPSFDAMPGVEIPKTWKGVCDKGSDPKFRCNNKLIGARYYGAEFDSRVLPDYETTAPTDRNGHGSHTASTAGGNADVMASIGNDKRGPISGMAPMAHIAAYKALWNNEKGGASGSSAALVKAIEDATADGVDVINYSVSGSSTSVVTAEELAFMGAADAGIFIAASAGNSGEAGPSKVAHNVPWSMTVAASTHDRTVPTRELTLGNGEKFTAQGRGKSVAQSDLILASAAGLPGADASKVARCFSDNDVDVEEGRDKVVTPVLDPAKIKGKIVVCERGGSPLVDRAIAVKNAGGVGTVIVDVVADQAQPFLPYEIPTVHLNSVSGDKVKAYAAQPGAKAIISAGMPELDSRQGSDVTAPAVASFSSYGPALAGGGDLLKPDISAPGVDVLAAVNADGDDANTFTTMQGTSMSAPHIAGLGALMKQKFPTWSPAAIKSAMMTTATTLDNKGKPIQHQTPKMELEPATPLHYGAGHVVPKDAYTPGLVYDHGIKDWKAYACSLGQLQIAKGEEACKGVKKIDPSDMNYPSIAVGDLAGKQVIKRTVTNVDSRMTGYTAQIKAPEGFKVSVFPRVLAIAPGTSQSFWVTIERTTAPMGQYAFGSLTWKGSQGQKVTSPIAVRPVGATVPELTVAKASDTTKFEFRAGSGGKFKLDVMGLVAPTVEKAPVVRDENSPIDGLVKIEVPKGVKLLRVGTNQATAGVKDVDLVLVAPDKQQYTSLHEGSTEDAIVEDPIPGTWYAALDLYSPEPTAEIPVSTWMVMNKDEGNVKVKLFPNITIAGSEVKATLTYKGLQPGHEYMGIIGKPGQYGLLLVNS